MTAETIFRGNNRHIVKSAGTEDVARVRVNEKLLQWAEIIFVMEKKHKQRLNEKFRILDNQQIIVLDIPDEYEYMDDELVQMLRDMTDHYLR